MFDDLLREINRCQAEFSFELSRCDDPYRLNHVLTRLVLRLRSLNEDAAYMVRELERNG